MAGLLILTQSFAAGEGQEYEPAKKGRVVKRVDVQAKKDKALAFLGDDLEFMADPNAIKARLKKFEGLESVLEEVNKESRNEVREWTRGIRKKIRIDEDELDDRRDLLEEALEQVLKELVFIRKIAVEEGAGKTTAAVEAVLLARRERYKKIYDQMEEAETRMDEMGREERVKRRNKRRVTDRDREKQRAYREEMVKKRRLPRRGRAEEPNSVTP
ncbi:MAG: hypothetical protein ACYS9T_06580 [Planctomycetota bacterium]